MRNKLRLLKVVLPCDIAVLIAIVLTALAFSASVPSLAGSEPAIIYVKADATGANNGTSWADAYTDLQDALTVANSGDEIWVAAGTYKPTTGTDRAASFQLKSGVALYGGFAGWETARAQRDWETNATILSGDIGTLGDNSDNSYHVIRGSDTNATAVLNGFTITGGNASGFFLYDQLGGGMCSYWNGSATLINVTFSGNSAQSGGGGMFNQWNSNPTLVNVTFSGNSAGQGGGMDNFDSNPTLTNCTFSDNQAQFDGGGMSNWLSDPTLINCTFSGNSSSGNGGGGMYNSDSNPMLTNCTFSGNSAVYGGAIHNGNRSSPILTNCTFSDNSARSGGGIHSNNHSCPMLTNCTLSGNSAHIGGGMYSFASNPTLRNTIIANSTGGDDCYGPLTSEGYNLDSDGTCGFTSEGDLSNTDPLLGPLQDNSGPALTHALLPGSPALDAIPEEAGGGDYNGAPTTDQRGVIRPQPSGGDCDIGAYEARGFTLTVAGAGTGGGTVTNAEIDCNISAGTSSGDCSETLLEMAIVTLKAQPGDDSFFVGWSGDCSGTEFIMTVTMDADKTCTATFNLKPPPIPVGGYVVAVNRLELLVPWLGLALAGAGGLVALRVTIARRREGG